LTKRDFLDHPIESSTKHRHIFSDFLSASAQQIHPECCEGFRYECEDVNRQSDTIPRVAPNCNLVDNQGLAQSNKQEKD